MKKRCVCCGLITPHRTYITRSRGSLKIPGSYSPVAADFGIFYNLLQCIKCSHIFSENASRKNLSRYKHADETGEYFECAKFREESLQRAFTAHLPFLSRKAGILDVGAGGGIFLNLLRKLGFRAEGVEPSLALCRKARVKFGIKIKQGVLGMKRSKGKSFDLVTLWEVIEHFDRPDLEITKIASHLKGEGKLLIATPNIRSLSALLLGTRWWSFRQMHIHYFSPKSLESLMGRLGFCKISESRYRKIFPLWYFLSKVLTVPSWLKKILCVPLQVSLGDMVHIYEKQRM